MAKKTILDEDGKEYVVKEKKPFYKKGWFIGLVIVIILGAITSGNKNKQTASTENANAPVQEETQQVAAQEEEATPQKEYYFDGEVAELENVTIRLTDLKVIPAGEQGNQYGDTPVIAFWYEVTNKSGKEIDPTSAWITNVTAIQDNDPNMVNKLNVGTLPDNQFLDSQLNPIKEGGTVANAISYKLTDNETPVTLVITNGMLGDELGAFNYEIN